MYGPLNYCRLNLCLQGHCLGLRGGKGHRQGADSSSSVEGEGTAVPGPGVSVQESVSELLRKFGQSRGPVHNDSFDVPDEPIESFSPFMTMEQVLASRDKYYRSRIRTCGVEVAKDRAARCALQSASITRGGGRSPPRPPLPLR
jgi:hypothetical protein